MDKKSCEMNFAILQTKQRKKSAFKTTKSHSFFR